MLLMAAVHVMQPGCMCMYAVAIRSANSPDSAIVQASLQNPHDSLGDDGQQQQMSQPTGTPQHT